MQFKKFNSDGITRWDIVSFEKIDQSQFKVNLINPVNLNNQMSGDIVAHYSTITVDISKIGEKILRVSSGADYSEYQYVGENKLIYDESTQYQPVDGGYRQERYCDWYKQNNH